MTIDGRPSLQNPSFLKLINKEATHMTRSIGGGAVNLTMESVVTEECEDDEDLPQEYED